MIKILLLAFCLPFPTLLDVNHNVHKPIAQVYSKKLNNAYALYVAILQKYQTPWETAEALSEKPETLSKALHGIVLTWQNQDPTRSLLKSKKDDRYHELPYLYYKKNLSSTRKKIKHQLKMLNTRHKTEQSAIFHCLEHVQKKIALLENIVITTPEYYREQIKIATIQKPLVLEIFQGNIVAIAQKIIPFFS